MKYYTSLENGAPEGGVAVVIEGTRLRIFFDYEKQEQVSTDDVEVDNAYVCENVDLVGTRSYGAIIAAIVSAQYTADDVTAIIANKALADDSDSDISDEKREEYLADYTTFQTWRAHAKEVAKTVLTLI